MEDLICCSGLDGLAIVIEFWLVPPMLVGLFQGTEPKVVCLFPPAKVCLVAAACLPRDPIVEALVDCGGKVVGDVLLLLPMTIFFVLFVPLLLLNLPSLPLVVLLGLFVMLLELSLVLPTFLEMLIDFSLKLFAFLSELLLLRTRIFISLSLPSFGSPVQLVPFVLCFESFNFGLSLKMLCLLGLMLTLFIIW